MPYQIPEHINPNKVFLVNHSALEGRLDPQYYEEHFDFHNFVKLSSIAKVSGGKRIPLGKDYSLEPTGFLYLRVADIQDEGIVDYNQLKCIDKDVFETLKRYEIYNGNLAISIAGTVGKVVIIKGIPNDKHVILTENCAKITIINNDILAEYFYLMLSMPIVQRQIELNYIQTTIPKLGLDRVNGLMLPQPPSIASQQEIIKIYNVACSQKLQKEQQAEALLQSIDDYLLGELGIQLPETKSQTIQDRMFVVNFTEVSCDRYDPKYNKNISYIRSTNSVFPWRTLDDVVKNNGQYGANESALDYNIGDIRYIRITDIDENGNLKVSDKKTAEKIDSSYLLNYNDVLFARSGSVGRCYIHKDTSEPAIFAGYLIRYELDIEKIIPDYLFYYCNSSIYHFWVETIQRPAVQANINSQEFRKLQSHFLLFKSNRK